MSFSEYQQISKFFSRVQHSLEQNNIPYFLKVKQVMCLEYLFTGHDVLAVLPTGYGKSLIFQLLPDLLTTRKKSNIVIVVCPLNSIIEDQLSSLHSRGIQAAELKLEENVQSNSLFDNDQRSGTLLTIPDRIKTGSVKLLFSHPESLLSPKGRELLMSTSYQENVVVFVIDEAHCVEMWGEEFRKEFRNLSTLKALLNTRTLTLTATATPLTLAELQKSLCLQNCKVVTISPNRPNLFIGKTIRKSNNKGLEGYDEILLPIADELNIQRGQYPMTIIYLKLRYCGYAFQLFSRQIPNHFVGNEKTPSSRLFAQFHASLTKKWKDEILEEIKRNSSRIRVIFATTALGMGVDAANIRSIIHIRPPSDIESYVQEVGRAGRDSEPCNSILYYNNSDTSSAIITESMKRFCQEDRCLRQYLMKYFGFSAPTQESCCSNCNKDKLTEILQNVTITQNKLSITNTKWSVDKTKLHGELKKILTEWNDINCPMYDCTPKDVILQNIIENMHIISSSSDIMNSYENFGIWDEELAENVFTCINSFSEQIIKGF